MMKSSKIDLLMCPQFGESGLTEGWSGGVYDCQLLTVGKCANLVSLWSVTSFPLSVSPQLHFLK